MLEPTPRASRLVVAAGFLATIVVGGGGFLLGQRSVEDRAPVAAPVVVAAPEASPLGLPPYEADVRELGRADLIALASLAADAVARGAELPADVGDAVGRRFSITLPFGCAGPAPADSNLAMRWRYDDSARALRLHIAPVTWAPADWWPLDKPPGLESVEGFWISRPWTSSDNCPVSGAPVASVVIAPIPPTGHTLAIGQIFDSEGTRQGRRDGKAYTAVVRMAADAVRAEQGFRLRLVGQLAAAPAGSAVMCRQPGGAEQRPICLIVTALDEVSIENAATGETLARWTVAGKRSAE
jgi:hypothetical protein